MSCVGVYLGVCVLRVILGVRGCLLGRFLVCSGFSFDLVLRGKLSLDEVERRGVRVEVVLFSVFDIDVWDGLYGCL